MASTIRGIETGSRSDRPLAKVESALSGLVVVILGLYFLLQILARERQLPASGLTIAAAVALSLCVLARLAYVVLKPDFDFVIPAFYLFTFVWMSLAPLTQLVMRRGPLAYDFRLDAYESGLLLVTVGIVSYEIGAAVAFRQTSKRPGVALRSISVSIRALTWGTLGGIPLVAITLASIGGPSILFTSRFAFSAAVFGNGDSKVAGAIINAILLVVPFVLAFLWIIAAHGKRRLGPVQWLLLLLSNFLNITVNNPIVQGRFWVATVLLSMLGAVFAAKWRAFGRIAIPASLFFLVVIFPFSDVFRHAETSRQLKIEDPVSQLALKGDFDAFPQLAETTLHVQRIGVEWGHQLSGTIGFFVPRSLWPGKSVDTGTLLGTEAGLGNMNLSAPLWAEGYIDFGVFGVIAYLLLLGYIMARVSSLSAVSGLGPGFSIFIGLYQFVILRGSLLQSMGITVAILLMLFAVLRRNEIGQHEDSQLWPRRACEERNELYL